MSASITSSDIQLSYKKGPSLEFKNISGKYFGIESQNNLFSKNYPKNLFILGNSSIKILPQAERKVNNA